MAETHRYIGKFEPKPGEKPGKPVYLRVGLGNNTPDEIRRQLGYRVHGGMLGSSQTSNRGRRA